MKIGIYGGSFNPVHYGHIGLANYVLEHTDLDEIWMMVTPNNPMKESGMLANEHVRLKALQKAIKNSAANNDRITHEKKKRIVASDFEFSLDKPSYTANTLRRLTHTYPHYTFVLIMGEDNWDIFDRWKEHDYILNNFPIIIYPRKNKNSDSLTKTTACPAVPWTSQGNITYLDEAPLFNISSTEIREGKKTSA